jgi:hypothetical protein
VTSMCEIAGPQFKGALLETLLAQGDDVEEEEEEEEPDLVFNRKMAAGQGSQLYTPPACSSEEGYASAAISPSGDIANNDE